ncbi:MAG: hypothetical protein PHW10_02505 [Candidatus Peribacteraceae bacterium]|nr:hypothetical protein [Candidatus Peribacteraceae bacterium]
MSDHLGHTKLHDSPTHEWQRDIRNEEFLRVLDQMEEDEAGVAE